MANDDKKSPLMVKKSRGGPATTVGRAVVSYNATKHGLRSRRVLPWEDQNEHDAMHAAIAQYLAPADDVEAELVRNFAEALWRLRRVEHAEAVGFEKAERRARQWAEASASLTPEGHGGALPVLPPHAAEAPYLVGLKGKDFLNIAAYETSLQRSARRWLEMLERMRRLRGGTGGTTEPGPKS